MVERVGPPLSEIEGIADLLERIEGCETAEDWSWLLADYIRWGTYFGKVHSSVAVFNLGSAHDCPNRWTDSCQVDGDQCYAVKTEKRMDYTLQYYRRQEVLWDCLDARTWAEAFKLIVERKTAEAVALRFNQSGDFRHDGDVVMVNEIAKRLEGVVDVYTYTASDYLDWSEATHFTVNQSNSKPAFGGDRRYRVVDSPEQIPDDAIHCPHDLQEHEGVRKQNRIECGECRLCIDADAGDVWVTMVEKSGPPPKSVSRCDECGQPADDLETARDVRFGDSIEACPECIDQEEELSRARV